MSPTQMSYVNELVGGIECLETIKQEQVDEWAPDPPLINVMLGDLGRGIAENFYALPESEKVRLFEHIENGMNSTEEDLSTAVATGLIEALVGAGERNPSLWPAIEAALGTESKDYAITWKNFDYSLPPKTNLM